MADTPLDLAAVNEILAGTRSRTNSVPYINDFIVINTAAFAQAQAAAALDASDL
jgi:hypothetical protein